MLQLLLALALSAGSALPAQDGAGYRVGPGDVLQVELPDYPEYNRSSAVQADGTITLNRLKGNLKVSGLSILEIQAAVRDKYLADKELSGNPTVAVTVTRYHSQKVFVQGEVAKPGDLYIEGPDFSLLRAIGGAGGFTPRSGASIEIRRRTAEGRTEALPPLDRRALTSGAIPDPLLQDKDVIVVSVAPTYIMTGEVDQKGEKIWEPGINVERAIALAGGPTKAGSKDRVEITRKGEKVKDVNKNTLILPNDIVDVKKRLMGLPG